MDSNIQKLLGLITEQLDWGEATGWQGRDFENLSELIYQRTRVKLSDSTLKRVWGKVNYGHLPSATTLDTLAQFAGFENWRAFVKQQAAVPGKKRPLTKISIRKIAPAVMGALLLTMAVMIFLSWKHRVPIATAGYHFSSRLLTHTLPNTVIFSYDAAAAYDSVFIQQSWDPKSKTPVDKKAHTFTAFYNEPGFYHAKLVVGRQTVQEHNLMIPTSGWLGWIAAGTMPVYLDSTAFLHPDCLELPVSAVLAKDPELPVKPPYVRYYNVGNFKPVPVTDFSFSAEVKNGYNAGAAACQFISVLLVTDGDPIIIPLSGKGCVSELTLFSADQKISGKNTDLSGFAIRQPGWVTVSCRSTSKSICYYIDDRLAYEAPLPKIATKIVGIGFSFQGTGSVRQIMLREHGRLVFNAF